MQNDLIDDAQDVADAESVELNVLAHAERLHDEALTESWHPASRSDTCCTFARVEAAARTREEPLQMNETKTTRPRPGWAGTLAALARFAVVVLSITLTLAIAWRLFAIVAGA